MRDYEVTERGMPKKAFLFLWKFIVGVWSLMFCIAALPGIVQAEESDAELYAKSAVLMDADSGRVLVEKDGKTMRPMASTTKILTCILALEEGNLDDVVTVSGEAAAQPKVHLGMEEGETFYLRDLLYSLMLESHNDSAVAIAEHLAGSVPEFAKRMNEKAKEIGCENAHFVTPNGLDGADEGGVHSITAEDLARIMSYCVAKSPKSKEFLEVTQKKEHAFTDVSGQRNFSCRNHNLFLSMMDGAISGKTGFTGDAGYCYVGALRRDGKTFVVALLACGWPNNKNYKWADTKRLMNYGLENYEYRDVREQSQSAELEDIPVEKGIGKSGGLFENAFVPVEIVDTDQTSEILMREDEQVRVEVTQENLLSAPVKKGQIVGEVQYFLGDELVDKAQVAAAENIKKRSFLWVFGEIFKILHQFEVC